MLRDLGVHQLQLTFRFLYFGSKLGAIRGVLPDFRCLKAQCRRRVGQLANVAFGTKLGALGTAHRSKWHVDQLSADSCRALFRPVSLNAPACAGENGGGRQSDKRHQKRIFDEVLTLFLANEARCSCEQGFHKPILIISVCDLNPEDGYHTGRQRPQGVSWPRPNWNAGISRALAFWITPETRRGDYRRLSDRVSAVDSNGSTSDKVRGVGSQVHGGSGNLPPADATGPQVSAPGSHRS